jgi:cell shape-determining protein MreC
LKNELANKIEKFENENKDLKSQLMLQRDKYQSLASDTKFKDV